MAVILYYTGNFASDVLSLTEVAVRDHLILCSVNLLSGVFSPQLPVLDSVANNDAIWLSRCCPCYSLLIKIDNDFFYLGRYCID